MNGIYNEPIKMDARKARCPHRYCAGKTIANSELHPALRSTEAGASRSRIAALLKKGIRRLLRWALILL
jgi:hypothetical protein